MIYIVILWSIYGPAGELLNRKDTNIQTYFDISRDTVLGFLPSRQIDDSTLPWCVGPFLHVLEDNTIYALLESGPGDGTPRYIRFTRSRDIGKTWLYRNRIIRYDPNIIIYSPSMVVGHDGTINVVWAESHNNGILFSCSIDSGFTWSGYTKIDDSLPSGHERQNPDITGYGDTLYVCWYESSPASYPWVKMSTNGGATWINESQISAVLPNWYNNSHRLYIRNDPFNNRLYIVWSCDNGEIYVARSSDCMSWEASLVTIDNLRDASMASMALAPDGTIYVVWTEARYGQYDTDIFLSRSTDGGITWSHSILVNDRAGLGANQYEPHIACDSKKFLHVSWIECYPFGSMTNAYYTLSSDNGDTWWEPNLIVTDIPYTISPNVPYSLSIAADTNSCAYIGWAYYFGPEYDFFSTNCTLTVIIQPIKAVNLHQINLDIRPNPFRNLEIINCLIQDSRPANNGHWQKATLQIFDVTGRLIKQWIYESTPYKMRRFDKFVWDGKDNTDKQVANGIYYCKLQTNDLLAIKKIIRIH